MKNQDEKNPYAAAWIIAAVIALILTLFMIKVKTIKDNARAKAYQDSVNATRLYYRDSILNYQVDTSDVEGPKEIDLADTTHSQLK